MNAPQLQVQREQVDKSRSFQGGNQVFKYDYRIRISSYKAEAVKLQLSDRLPHSEGDAVNVMLVTAAPELSTDPAYQRDARPKNLLRWDLSIPPRSNGDKAVTVTYQYKMEFSKDAMIGNFLAK